MTRPTTLFAAAQSTASTRMDPYGSVAGAATESVGGEHGGPFTPPTNPEKTMVTQTKKLAVHATTGVAKPEYGQNPYLALHAPDAPRGLPTERRLAAAAYRAAAAVEERLIEQSTCAVCVDGSRGYIHLEFSERATRAEQDAARAVLDAVAGEINRKGRV